MKTIVLALFVFALTSCSLAQAQEVTGFQWDAVTTSIDGSTVTEPVHYRLYCGDKNYNPHLAPPLSPPIDLGEATSAPINIPGADITYKCFLTAYGNVSGNESPFSNEQTVVKQAGKYYTGGTLNAPSNFRVK